MALDQRIAAPYGNIFTVGTPALDKVSQQLYAQDQQRQQQQLQNNKMLDEEFSRNLAGIRDADLPDLEKAYGDFKTKSQQLMKMKGGGTPTDQLNVLRSKANMYDIINKSKQTKDEEKQIGSFIMKNGNNVADNAHNYLIERMNTPVSKLGLSSQYKDESGNPVDLTDPGTYSYTPTTDFSKQIKSAVGTYRDLGQFDESDPKALNKTIAKYRGFNSPYQTYNNLTEALKDPRLANSFIKTHQFSPEQEQQITERYNQIAATPRFQKAYGLNGNETFPGEDTDLGKAVKLATMLSTVAPARDVTTPINQEVKTQRSEDFRKQMQRQGFIDQQIIENIRNKHINERPEIRAAGLSNDADTFIDNQIKDANNGVAAGVTGAKEIKASPVVLQAFQQTDPNTGHKYSPTAILALPNDQFKLTGNGVDITIPREEYKAALVNHVFNTPTKLGQISKPATTNTPIYKTSDLKANGWTDEQIKIATKAGKIKVQ